MFLIVKSIRLSAAKLANIGLTYIDIVDKKLNKGLRGCVNGRHLTG